MWIEIITVIYLAVGFCLSLSQYKTDEALAIIFMWPLVSLILIIKGSIKVFKKTIKG